VRSNISSRSPTTADPITLDLDVDPPDRANWQLFADPAAAAGGDLTSVRYHWDCG
jgi:hypothetical protein